MKASKDFTGSDGAKGDQGVEGKAGPDKKLVWSYNRPCSR